MSTEIRPEIAKCSDYWISKHRYYELKHFCLQYLDWLRLYHSLDGYFDGDLCTISKTEHNLDQIANLVDCRLKLKENIHMIQYAAKQTDPVIGPYILKAVTTGTTYPKLKLAENVPCCRDIYYNLYRKFFWLLSNLRI